MELKGHTSGVYGVAFSPDGHRLASANADRTVKLWETVCPPLEILRQRDLHERAFDWVEYLFATRVRRTDVIQSLHGDSSLSDVLRQAALTLAEQYRQDSRALNQASSAVVLQPDASTEAYRQALLQAEEACRLEPENGGHVKTLGVAQYRLGQYPAAVETLARSLTLNVTADGPHPARLQWLARAQHQLGRKEETQATLARLREALAKPRWTSWASSPEYAAFLREAETLLQAAPATKK